MGKHLRRNLSYFILFLSLFIKKETLAQVFSCEFCEFFIETLGWLLLTIETFCIFLLNSCFLELL